MDIKIYQKSGEIHENNKNVLQFATKYFIEQTTKKKDRERLKSIKIYLCKNMKLLGECEDKVLTEKNTTFDFILRLNLQSSFLEMFSTLAHECVHISQTLRGDMLIDDNNEWWWKGKSYGKFPYETIKKEEHLPWEREAYYREQQLAKKFINNFYKIENESY